MAGVGRLSLGEVSGQRSRQADLPGMYDVVWDGWDGRDVSAGTWPAPYR